MPRPVRLRNKANFHLVVACMTVILVSVRDH